LLRGARRFNRGPDQRSPRATVQTQHRAVPVSAHRTYSAQLSREAPEQLQELPCIPSRETRFCGSFSSMLTVSSTNAFVNPPSGTPGNLRSKAHIHALDEQARVLTVLPSAAWVTSQQALLHGSKLTDQSGSRRDPYGISWCAISVRTSKGAMRF
jgi:hypothetical protein